MREVFYRTYGIPFNALPPPHRQGRWARFDDFAFDADHGAAQVGGRIKGLDLVSSRVDGSISGDNATAYVEWVFEFRNTSLLDREARVGLALPPGAVVSRATLWVNGEEREAAYGGRSDVRKAYQEVAIRQARDPLLVTTKGADRVLAQAFPVPRNGGTIKFKIGMTAPLQLLSRERAALTLPAIVERNFSFSADTKHALWIEGERTLTFNGPGLKIDQVTDGNFRLKGSITDRDLALLRPQIITERDAAVTRVLARANGSVPIVQEIVDVGAAQPGTLMIVLDASKQLGPHAQDIAASLDTIPKEVRVGLMVAGDVLTEVAPAKWTSGHARTVKHAILNAGYAGGKDNTEALTQAIMALEREPQADLLWIHGPQPMTFRSTAGQLEQVTQRLSKFPRLTLYAVEPGPNELLPDEPWAWGATLWPARGSMKADLTAYLTETFVRSGALTVTRRADATDAGRGTGSEHIARLWARDEVLSLMIAKGEAARAEAVQLAADQRLVTPVSGAVVLETQRQFAENNLSPVNKSTVPTVPEPHEWAMIIMAALMLLWMAWKQWQSGAIWA
jgi:hypothetical protein